MKEFKTLKNGYRFSKKIFRYYLLIFLLLSLLVIVNYYSQDKHYYIGCPVENYRPCANPYYNNCPPQVDDYVCELETIPAGVYYGNDNNLMYENFTTAVIMLLFFCFVINHLKYNKGFAK